MSATDTTAETAKTSAAGVETAQLGIEGMHCASCVARVERELRSVPGVLEASVNLTSEEARVSFVPAAVEVGQLEQAVQRAGYTAHAKADQPAENDLARQDHDRAREYPDTIVVQHGTPVRLSFLRRETAACSEEVVFPDFARRAQLPEGEFAPVDFTPDEAGEYEFTCGMGMLRDKLVVQ